MKEMGDTGNVVSKQRQARERERRKKRLRERNGG
jgi:hypothetical protein